MRYQVYPVGQDPIPANMIYDGEFGGPFAKENITQVTKHVKTELMQRADAGTIQRDMKVKVVILNAENEIHDAYILKAGKNQKRRKATVAPVAQAS